LDRYDTGLYYPVLFGTQYD